MRGAAEQNNNNNNKNNFATSLLDDFQWPSVQKKIFYPDFFILLTRSLTTFGSASIFNN